MFLLSMLAVWYTRGWLSEYLLVFYSFMTLALPLQVGRANGKLTRFIIEPFVAHKQHDEYYLCIYSHRHGDTILFYHEGGVDVGDVDAKVHILTYIIVCVVCVINNKLLCEGVTAEALLVLCTHVTKIRKAAIGCYSFSHIVMSSMTHWLSPILVYEFIGTPCMHVVLHMVSFGYVHYYYYRGMWP